jgi:Mg-chelatase subunit ChlD
VGNTNISAGMNKARLDLQNNGRTGALKMMVLMTDGLPNLPSSGASSAVITEANLCAAAKIPVVCISLGSGADTSLLQQVSDITNGAHFIVEGGRPISEVQADLEAIFAQVAADRPLKLVQ